MIIEKTYNIEETVNGVKKSISITLKIDNFNESFKNKNDLQKHLHISSEKSLYKACQEYINMKSNILSPSTILNYKRIVKQLYKEYNEFMNMDIKILKQEHMI